MTEPVSTRRPPDVVAFGEFALDKRSGTFIGPRGPLLLRPKSHELLCYLVERRNELVTKQELMSHLWPDVRVTDDSLVKCMRDVRSALGDDSKLILQTVPRRGYRLTVGSTPIVAPLSQTHVLVPKRILTIAAVLIALAVVAAVVVHARRRAFRSLAVLPFTTVSGQARDPVLEVGIADMLMTRLSNDRRVTVRPMSSVQRYANAGDAASAGRQLGVDAVMEGHLQRVGDRLRVSVNVLRTSDGRSLWADTFEESVTGIDRLEDAISDRAAAALMLHIDPRSKKARPRPGVDAYSSYMRGRYYLAQRTETSVARAIESFEGAIARDPSYAEAHAALAQAEIVRGVFFTVAPNPEPFASAREAALAALGLDDTLADAHSSLAFIHLWYEWDFAAAEREFRRALELNPQDADAHQQYGQLLLAERRYPEAIAQCRRAVELDPAYVLRPTMLGYALYMSRQYSAALTSALDALDLQPDFWMAHNVAGMALRQLGRTDEAFAQTMLLHKDLQDPPERLRALETAWGTLGFTGVREEELRQAAGMQRVRILAELGRKEEALTELEHALAQHDGFLIYLRADPRYDAIRDDPRFEAVARQVGIP